MKFRIMSDLHLDVNEKYPFQLSGDKDIITLIAGDIAGQPRIRCEWLNKQIADGYTGFYCEGNHVVYHNDKTTIDEVYNQERVMFPNDQDKPNSFTFLENDCVLLHKEAVYDESIPEAEFSLNNIKEWPEDVLVIGTTLWTDFSYCGSKTANGYIAERRMNDYRFRCIKTLPEEEYKGNVKNRWNDGTRNMRWEDQAEWHKKALETIDRLYKEYSNKCQKVVIVSHHAPTPLSISPDYAGSDTNAAYVSNLGNFILAHPKIELWVHGHVHSFFDYRVGNCRIVCNPRGYVPCREDIEFNPNLIIEV